MTLRSIFPEPPKQRVPAFRYGLLVFMLAVLVGVCLDIATTPPSHRGERYGVPVLSILSQQDSLPTPMNPATPTISSPAEKGCTAFHETLKAHTDQATDAGTVPLAKALPRLYDPQNHLRHAQSVRLLA